MLLNPRGLEVVGYVSNLLGSNQVTSLVTEWASPTIRDLEGRIFFLFVIGLVVFLMAAIVFGWIIRFGVLLVLTVAAPLALACHGLPQLDAIAKLWWRSLFGTLGIQVLQALVLLAGIGVFLTPDEPVTA